jgi:hypothetical protein
MARVFNVSGTVSFKVDGKLEPEIDDSFTQNIFGGDKLSMAALEAKTLEILHKKHDGKYKDDEDKSQHKYEVGGIQIEAVQVLAYDVIPMGK